jgi:hypothetical protein
MIAGSRDTLRVGAARPPRRYPTPHATADPSLSRFRPELLDPAAARCVLPPRAITVAGFLLRGAVRPLLRRQGRKPDPWRSRSRSIMQRAAHLTAKKSNHKLEPAKEGDSREEDAALIREKTRRKNIKCPLSAAALPCAPPPFHIEPDDHDEAEDRAPLSSPCAEEPHGAPRPSRPSASPRGPGRLSSPAACRSSRRLALRSCLDASRISSRVGPSWGTRSTT